MKFSRITEQQAYDHVVEATKRLHEKGVECGEISAHPSVKALGLDYSRCTTPGYGLIGEGEYSAVFVADGDNGYRVFDIYIDTLSPEDTRIDDISGSLGQLNPEHKQCDIRKSIPMAILHYLELFGNVPTKYKQYASKG